MATERKDWKSIWEQEAAKARKLAKRANQRLKRIETYSERSGMSEIKKFAYKNAKEYIVKSLGGNEEKPRFKEHIKLYDVGDLAKDEADMYYRNVQIQRHRIKAMEEFLAADTSTLGTSRTGPKTQGIQAIFDKRTETVNQKLKDEYGAGYNYTDAELKGFFDSKKQAKLETVVGSDLMFVVAKIIKKKSLKSNKRDLERYFKQHIDMEATGLSKEDLKARKGENYKAYIDRLGKFVEFSEDEVLNKMVKKALKEGINAENIFLE